MSMYFTKPVLFSILLLFSLQSISQESFEGLGETAFSLNHEFSNNYKTNFAIRSRYFFYKDENFNFKNRQVDFVHFSTLNLDYNKSLSIGIQYRIRESIDGASNELRVTQQFNYTKKNLALRFGHRFRFEQRVLSNITILRSRYRFALDFPLNGEKLDVNEGYFIGSTEILLSKSTKIKPEIDHRITGNFGWVISEKSKIQLSLEYRFETLNIKTENKLFVLSGYILKI